MGNISELYKAINAVSQKLNDAIKREADYTDNRDNANEKNITDTQNALIELDEDRLQAQSDSENALIELDEEIHQSLAEIENALCELTEEGGY